MKRTLISRPTHALRSAILAATAVLLAACQTGGELKFDWGHGAPVKLPSTPGYSELFVTTEQLGALIGTCMSGAQVQYTARNYQRSTETEAVLFAMSPYTAEGSLVSLSDSSKLQGSWQASSSNPTGIPTPLSLRVALGPEPSAPQPGPALVAPPSSSFWGSGPAQPGQLSVRTCVPFGGNPNGPTQVDASFKAAAVYYHGA